MDPAQKRGLEAKKFEVTRCDGSSAPGGKHADCNYFVLDLTHDAFAPAALEAYADACEAKYPLLAQEIREKLLKLDPPKATHCEIAMVNGPEGPHLAINSINGSGYRLAGPKAWGGGTLLKSFKVSIAELIREAKSIRKHG